MAWCRTASVVARRAVWKSGSAAVTTRVRWPLLARVDFQAWLFYPQPMMQFPGVLDGVRVLDLADEPGVYCGKLLADMGADVIKVEPPAGAAMRRIGPFFAEENTGTGRSDCNRSLFFWHYNTNKRSVIIDLKTAEGSAIFLRLAATADIIIETAAPARLEALGLGYATLAACNPRLVVVSITPFGQTGPHRDFRGSDLVAQALGGMVYVNGFEHEPPLQGVGLQAYHCASIYAAIGTMLALLARQSSGHGQWIDVSLQECVAASVEHATSFFHQDGTIAERHGSLHWTRSFRVARCQDGYAVHCTLGDWTSLIEWVNAEGKAQDLLEPVWQDFNHRRDHCVHLFDVLDEWAKEYRVAELVEGAQLRRLPYAAVLPPEALRHAPQLQQRGFFTPVRHEELGKTFTYPGAPYVFSRTPWRIRRRPPFVGEHNHEVLAEIEGSKIQRAGGSRVRSIERASQGQKPLPLDGIRVIDFTWAVAGPVASRILADHGAEVIKIERRDALELGARRGGFSGNLNRNKQSIVINMSSARGIELAKELIATADVVVENFSARVMRNWGLDDYNLCRIKSDIIVLNMSGFGHTGSQRDYVSYGPTLQALSGYTWLMRHPEAEPAGWGFSYADMAAGYSGALAVLFALWHRKLTGEGQRIDLSQFENVTALLGPLLLDTLVNGGCATPVGNGSQEREAAPHGVYRCTDFPGDGGARDRWCAIAVFGDEDWRRFCRVLGEPRWTRDERFTTMRGRMRHRVALNAHVESWTRGRTAEEVMAVLQDAGVAAGLVANAEDVCRRDHHLQARQYWSQIATPEGDVVEVDGVPFKMSATAERMRTPGPLPGEHTDAILQRVLGMNAEAIAALRAAEVIV
jgi:crotonobetainyl-CoA:carnitine CoA-transferase CaiB-like acyl-CoA transferase